MLFAPILGDRTHLDAAIAHDGLRKRSAGGAAEMFLRSGHWNKSHGAHCSRRAKMEFFCACEDCVTVCGGGVAEDGRQRTEDGERKTEDGRRRTEDGERRTEDGGRKAEDGGRKAEDGRRRTEDGGRKTGAEGG